ncbi:LOW QUALITY PROTEIN: protein FAM220A-like, partial [Megaptera novaeangliae]
GTLSIRLAEEKGAGDDSDKILYGLNRTQKESPCPSDITSRTNKLAVDVNGNSQNEELTLEKNDLSKVSFLLHDGNKALPCLQESIRRNSASAAAQRKLDLFFAPAKECFAGVSCGTGEAQVRHWLGGGPTATESHRGQSHKGEPGESGLPASQKWSEMGICENEPPSAFLERLDSELELSCLHSILSTLPAHPQIFLNDETKCVFPGHSKLMFSEQTVEYKKMLSCEKSTPNDLQITLALLALQAFELANLLCHN